MTALAQVRALQALEEAELPRPRRLSRVSSVTNEVWVTEDVVIRINRRVDGRLRREAALAEHLPEELGYPEIIAYGGRPGADWLILRRVNGTVLSRYWPAMDVAHRRRAVRDLAGKLKVLHATRTPVELPPLSAPQLLEAGCPEPTKPLRDALARARDLEFVDAGLIDSTDQMVAELRTAILPFLDWNLVHGDVTFENVLWDGERITAMLDFEWSRGAPRDVELDVLLRMCAFPFLHVAADYEKQTRPIDYMDVPRWLADDDPDLFGAPRLADRLVLYALAYDVRELLMHPPQGRSRTLSPYHPLNRIQNTLRGASHLAWLQRATV